MFKILEHKKKDEKTGKKEEPAKDELDKNKKNDGEYEEIAFDSIAPEKAEEKKAEKKAGKKGKQEKAEAVNEQPPETKPAPPAPKVSADDPFLELRKGISGIYMLMEQQNRLLERLVELTEQKGQKIGIEDMDEIDRDIAHIIEDKGKIEAKKLQDIVNKKKICSTSTLYLHLRRLTHSGILRKSRNRKFVFYEIAGSDKNIKNS